MQMYGDPESQSIYGMNALLYVQEVQLNKFHQGLTISPISAMLHIKIIKQTLCMTLSLTIEVVVVCSVVDVMVEDVSLLKISLHVIFMANKVML